MSRIVLISGVVALLVLPVAGMATPSTEEVAQARQTCRIDQAKQAPLERNAPWCTDDQKVLQARSASERSCGEAMKLMVAAGLEPKPVAPQPAPPTPSVTITEKVSVASASAPPTEFAAVEADRLCTQAGTATR